MKALFSLLSLCLIPVSAVQAASYVPVGSSSTLWTPMAGNYDFHTDQQTGGTNNPSSSDIVGAADNSGFLVAFNDNGGVSSIDGSISFRVRLDINGGSTNSPAFTNVVWVAIDANADGILDVFLGANFQGSNSQLEIRAPSSYAAGTNISPSTTEIANSTYRTYTLDTIEDATPANFSYRPVNFLTDGGNTNDVTVPSTGDADYYLSFMIPFADIVQFLGQSQNPITITDATPLRFVSATATQVNSLNQDLGGVNGGVNSPSTWEDLGGITAPFVPVPEPSSSMLTLSALAGACLIRRRR